MEQMEIRKAKEEDLPGIMEIYGRARSFMAENGNRSQWGDTYPPRELVRQDIEQGRCYVCESENGVEGVFYFSIGEDPTYLLIEEGEWKNEEPYGAIHRVASMGRIKGVAPRCIQWCQKQCPNLRIDTHEDNKVMQRVLEKNGFCRCGKIYAEDGTPRIAYQKICAQPVTDGKGCESSVRNFSL